MKLHLCCGDIYLEDYINIDIRGILWNKDPDKNPNLTTVDNYYKNRVIGERRKCYTDYNMDLTKKWAYKANSIDEILMISTIEHFTLKEAKKILKECYRVLKSGGLLKLDFPDLPNTIKEFYRENPEYCMRLIYCNHKDPYSIHKWGYSVEYFKTLLSEIWGSNYRVVSTTDIVTHDYPMIGMKIKKL
jgi:predicted SAM-dependent methyltransferase